MHDTVVDWEHGESIRTTHPFADGDVTGMSHDIDTEVCTSGYTKDEICRGIGPAIQEFLDKHGDEWVMDAHFENNNGLTVLRRCCPTQTSVD